MDSEGRAGAHVWICKTICLGYLTFYSPISPIGLLYFTYFHIGKIKFREAGWISDFKVALLVYGSRCLNPNLQSSNVYFLSTKPYLFSGESLSTSNYACQGSAWKPSVILSPKAICKMIWLYKTANLVGVAQSCLYCNLLFSLPLGYFYSYFNRWRNEYCS